MSAARVPPRTPVRAPDGFASVLLPGETIRWQGRPDPAARSSGWTRGCLGIPFVLFGGLAMLAALGGVFSAQAPGGTRLLLLAGATIPAALFAVGLILLLQPWRERREAERTRYAVTDRRLLTLIGGERAQLIAISAHNLGPTHLTVGADGRGSIVVETHSRKYDIDSAIRLTETYAWEGVDDAAYVYRLIEELRTEEPRP